jgi:hypothetical protein
MIRITVQDISTGDWIFHEIVDTITEETPEVIKKTMEYLERKVIRINELNPHYPNRGLMPDMEFFKEDGKVHIREIIYEKAYMFN